MHFMKGKSKMNKAKKKQQAIRQKLIAAIAMLMVSAIMVVSSSYAWFTLSTAPEVTGIQTSIGANGNLEMALNNGGVIGTANGTTVLPEKNNTWGNLVDLSTSYGLDLVKLLPSRLDVADGALKQSLLQVPTYGVDGRVSGMEGVLQGIYANGSIPTGNGNGVRLFGTSAGMSDEELALRSAKVNFSSYMDAAKGKAASALTANGGKLAGMAITHGVDTAGTATFTSDQVEALNNVVLALEAAANDLETALKYAVKAAATTQEGGHTFSIEGQTLEQVITAFEAASGEDISYLDTFVGKLDSMKSNIAAAKAVMTTALEKDSNWVWTDFADAINALMDSSNITVNGMSITEVRDDPGALAQKYMDDREIVMNVPTGAGIFADIADFTGNYSAPITIASIDYDPIHLENVPATMKATTTESPAYIDAVNAVLGTLQAFTGGGDTSLSDLYAYAIDLAFRTNAADSNLLLQTEAADRIYEDNTNDQTMGGGSYMEFTVATGYKLETAKRLMGCIRVVLMSTNNGDTSATAPTIYKVAILDVDNLETTANGTVKVPLKLVNYSITSGELVITTNAQGKPEFAADNVIMALNQNAQQNLTALVYLDGNIADNSMVANGEFSLTGQMNLQFASSAELKPMEYTDLHIPGESTEATTESTEATTESTAATEAAGG